MAKRKIKSCCRCGRSLHHGEGNEYACLACTDHVLKRIRLIGALTTVAVDSLVVAFSEDTGKLLCVSSMHDRSMLSVTGWAVAAVKQAEAVIAKTKQLKQTQQVARILNRYAHERNKQKVA